MIKEKGIGLFLDCIKGRIRIVQLVNLIKYVLGGRKVIVNWEPVFLEIYTTSRCNLNCAMCLTHSTKHENTYGKRPSKDMELDIFKRILNKFNKALLVELAGCGEPLLNKDLFQMAEYASKTMKMYVATVTNGTLVGQYKEQIVNSYIDTINISINGYNSQEYTRLTGMPEECFGRIVKNITELVKLRNVRKNKRLEIWISFIIDSHNYKFIQQMVDLAQELGVNGASFLHFIASPAEGFTPEERCIMTDNKDAIREIKRLQDNKSSRIKIKVNLHPLDKKLISQSSKLKYCRLPFYILGVDGEGNLGACSCQIFNSSEDIKFDQKDVWNNAYFQEFRKRLIETDLPLFEPCTWCNNNSPFSI